MSGIVGIVNLDRAPVDPRLLRQMTDFMAYRGPDGREIWVDGHVGLGHTLLRTTPESQREWQPCSLEGEVWITADARVDGRADLVQNLESRGRKELEAATDVALILHAYHVWGERCVEHLMGDFAFAIWDRARRRLFCACDQIGVKPLYYAHVGHSLVFSNTLNCVRIHPAVSDRLDDLYIADFLLFGHNEDPATTAFADIRELAAGHHLTWSDGPPRPSRYWALSVGDEIRYRRASEYPEHFRELMRTAVEDRLRTDRVAVLMSGGLDSTTVAATARDLLAERSAPFDLRAYTMVWDRVIPDKERYFSGLAGEALGVPIHYLAVDDYRLYERLNEPELRQPEPDLYPLFAALVDQLRQVAAHSRVVLTGWDGDSLLCEPPKPHLVRLLRGWRFGRLAADTLWYIRSQGHPPPLGLRPALRRALGKGPKEPECPRWLNQAFAARLDLPARWREMNEKPAASHPRRPRVLRGWPAWSPVARDYDAGVTSVPLEVRHPLFDLRVVNYLLSVPPVPWCVNKELVRAAMRGVLPEAVRRRPKAMLAGDPIRELLRDDDARWVDHFEPVPDLAMYVNRAAIPRIAGKEVRPDARVHLRPLSLSYWLQHSKPCTAKG